MPGEKVVEVVQVEETVVDSVMEVEETAASQVEVKVLEEVEETSEAWALAVAPRRRVGAGRRPRARPVAAVAVAAVAAVRVGAWVPPKEAVLARMERWRRSPTRRWRRVPMSPGA